MAISLFIMVALIAITVIIHHEGLSLTRTLQTKYFAPAQRRNLTYVVLLVFLIHLLEIVCWAFAFYILADVYTLGSIVSAAPMDASSYLYFSISTYSSLGIGDLYPTGQLRLAAGVQALLGLLMIGWSASHLYIEMQAIWKAECSSLGSANDA